MPLKLNGHHAWHFWNKIIGTCGFFFLLLQGIVVSSFAVNIPHADEWEMLRPDALDTGLNLHWLWRPHNEHRLVVTKAFQWALLKIGNLHLPTQTVINYFIYVALCGLVMRFVKERLKTDADFLWLPLSSTLLWEIHFWSFQSHFHLYLLFFVLGLGALLRRDVGRFFAIPCALLSAISFASGLICAVGVAGAAVCLTYVRPQRRRELLLQAAAILFLSLLWFFPAFPPSDPKMHAWPWRAEFWIHLGSTWARGLGFNQIVPFWLGLLVIVAGAVLGFFQYRRAQNASSAAQESWIVAGTFGLVMWVCTAITSFGRGSLPGMTHFIAPRYLENVLLVLPLFWALWEQMMPHRKGVLLASSFFLILPFLDELNARHIYATHHHKLISLQSCTSGFYRGEHGGHCSDEVAFEGGDLRNVLTRARMLHLSFAQESEATKKK